MKKYITFILLATCLILNWRAWAEKPYLTGNHLQEIAEVYTIDKNKAIGEIPFQTNVSPQGALTYTVPIQCYPASSGMQPNVSLIYNSMAATGVAGIGWNIGGLSSITRVSSSIHYDGEVKPATLDDDCAFMLDGIRLVKHEDDSGLISEQGNIRVYLHTNHFEVFYPNGNKAVYGYSNDTEARVSYPITEMKDPAGNSIHYFYDIRNNQFYINKIAYGTKTSSTHYASVIFSYQLRQDITVGYFWGKEVKQDWLLNKIETYYNGTLLKKYNLAHIYNDGSFLNRLFCVAGNGEEMNPLVFNYGEHVDSNLVVTEKKLTGYHPSVESLSTDSVVGLIPVRFSAKEGRNGLIVMPNKPTYIHNYAPGNTGYYDRDTAYIYKDILREQDTPAKFVLKGTDINNWDIPSSHFRGLFAIDYQGTGESKILKISEKQRDYEENRCLHLFEFFNSNGIKENECLINLYETYVKFKNIFHSVSRTYLTGDFDGTGKENLLYISHSKDINGKSRNSMAVYIDFETKQVIYNKACDFSVEPSDYLYTADFDGDGKPEIWHISKNWCNVYKFDPVTGFKFMASSDAITSGGLNGSYTILLGDINGDGKADILKSPVKSASNGIWTLIYSNGKDQLIRKQTEWNLCSYNTEYKYYLQDIDGDGLPELMVNKEGEVSIFLNRMGTYRSQEQMPTVEIDSRCQVMMSRVSESNKIYPAIGFKGEKLYLIESPVNESERRLLKSSTGSYGVTTNYTYGSLTEMEVCTIDNELVYPYNHFVEHIYLLTAVESGYNGTKIASVNYRYANPALHRLGLGFRGFGKTLTTDNIREITSTQIFDPLNYGVLKSTDSPVASATYNNSVTVDPRNKKVKILLSDKTENDKLTGVSVSSRYQYDTYGNPVKETVDYGNGLTSTSDTRVINIDLNGEYILGLPEVQTVTTTRDGKSATTKTVFDYNDQYRPVLQESYYDENKTSEKRFEYYSDGTLRYEKSKAYNATAYLTAAYEYDSYGRVTKETDPAGLFNEYRYNDIGLLWKTLNHKGHTTSFEYDVWGRNIKTSYPDGTEETLVTAWTTGPEGALYMQTSNATGQPETRVYYDALGREIRKGQKRFDGQYLYTDYTYDHRGRAKQTSLPHRGSPTLWNTCNYDNYDRITSLVYASGKKDTHSYNGLSTTSVTDGISVTKTADAVGQTVSVTDPGGTITYMYRPDGQPESITAPGDIVTSFEYDNYGRQTHIHDPSAGTKIFGYDNAGNINKETDARGKVINTVYDSYNRIKSKEVSGEFTVAYSYNSDGQPVSITSTNGTSVTYTYDNLLRTESVTEKIVDGKYLKKTFVYADGNVESVVYDSQSGNIATENYRYANGHHTEILLNNSLSIWKLTGENAQGMPTTSVTGPINRTYSYDAYGMPTGRSLKKGNTYVQYFSYNFDAKTGNLKYRKDSLRNIREDFAYDNLNRLNRTAKGETIYDIKGNIISSPSVKSFGYNSNKPYALEQITIFTADSTALKRRQEITYNTLMRPATIAENGYSATFTYNNAGERVKMHLKKDNSDRLIRYYIGGQYETDQTLAGTTEKLYLGGDAYSAAAVYVKENGVWWVNYIGRDYLGSITYITDEDGKLKEELSYDAWGRLRNPDNQAVYTLGEEPELTLGRGYTGHEHLPMFGLINMNARLYDPVVGRFLSPDPYVQAPWMTQNFNRYSYALNNPLRYTDPNGEFIPFLVAAGVGFTMGYIGHGITTGNWGFKAVVSGAIGAVTSAVGYGSSPVAMFSYSVAGAVKYSAYSAANMILSNIIPPIPIGNTGFSISPSAMLTAGIDAGVGLGSGFNFGAAVNWSKEIGDWTLVAGGSFSTGGYTYHGGFSYDDGKQGFSFVANKYGYKDPQVTGTIGYRNRDFSIKHENDLFGQVVFAGQHDRFRTAAVEIGYKSLLAGFSIYTTETGEIDPVKENYTKNPSGFHPNGKQLATPGYIGIRNGKTVTKIGVNNPNIGWFQNATHRATWPIFGGRVMESADFQYGTHKQNYFEHGVWNPFSLYTY